MPADDQESQRDEVTRVVRRWAKAFASGDADGVLAQFDSEYASLLHQPEEFPGPIRGWDDLTHYYRRMVELSTNMRDHALAEIEADVVGETAWCYLRGSVTFDIAGSDASVSGEARQSFLLRRRGDEWKIIHYHESRETPGLREPLADAHPRPDELRAGAGES